MTVFTAVEFGLNVVESSVIDVKENTGRQKYSKKTEVRVHEKSKFLIKLRWLNNLNQRYSEEYLPLETLRFIEEELELLDFDPNSTYFLPCEIKLEGDENVVIKKRQIKLERIIWKHYFYVYLFEDLFSEEVFKLKAQDNPKKIEFGYLLESFFEYSYNFFNVENPQKFLNNWYEIQYTDRSGRCTKRVIRVNKIIEVQEDGRTKLLLEANCLLRYGRVRNFRVSRIRAFRKLDDNF